MRSERGISFLEVVFSAALLSIVAATVSTGFSVIERLSRNGERSLAAYEVAHRLILQYLDNPLQMPDDSLPLPAEVTGRVEKFWYLKNESELTPEDTGESSATVRGSINTNLLSAEERIQAGLSMVTIEIYEDFNGRRGPAPIATLTRIYNPFHGSDDDPASFMSHLEAKFKDNPEIRSLFQSLAVQMRQEEERKKQQNAPPTITTQEAPQR